MEGDYRIDGERQVLQIADRIIAATLAEQAQLQWLYQADTSKIIIIPPGVDISHFYPIPPDEAKACIGVPQEDRMVLFVGRIEPLKGRGYADPRHGAHAHSRRDRASCRTTWRSSAATRMPTRER